MSNNVTYFSQSILIDNHKLECENFIKLLGIEINLNFEKHVTARQKARYQLNALSRIRKYIRFQEIKMLLDSFISSNFNFCPHPAALSKKIKKIQERVLRLLYNDSYSSYNSLLVKAERPTIEVSFLRILAID